MSGKSQGLPINVVVMMIIGLILFTMGTALFFQMYKSGEETLGSMNERIETDISARQCDGDHWLCAPSYAMRTGETKVFRLQLTNKEDTQMDLEVSLSNDGGLPPASPGANSYRLDESCGVLVLTPADQEVTLQPGSSAWYPFHVRIEELRERPPCSFIFSANVSDADPSVVNPHIEQRAITLRIEE